ncbi:MAG: hypothetical protein WC370_04785 [Dehalococcoidales bacterium]|jgi:hypothetical protein
MTVNRKEIANRVNIWVMMISGVALVVSAIATHDSDPMEIHIIAAVIFTVACLRHIIYHRKAVMRYIRGR